MDELPEFAQKTLEVLRQPLEDKIVTIARAKGALTFPANFMLMGALNPCPCGYWGDPTHEYSCAPATVTRYQNRISGPLLGRVDAGLESRFSPAGNRFAVTLTSKISARNQWQMALNLLIGRVFRSGDLTTRYTKKHFQPEAVRGAPFRWPPRGVARDH